MNTHTNWIRIMLIRDLGGLMDELNLYPSDELIWATVPGVSNSAGTIALHLCGNLQHYVGAVLGGTDYLRNRPLEFSRRDVPKPQLLAEIDKTIGVVSTLTSQWKDDRLSADYPDVLGGLRVPTGLFLQHLCTHLAHHLGQVGYLRRTLTGDSTSSGAISMDALQLRH